MFKKKLLTCCLIVIIVFGAIFLLLHGRNIEVFNPKGPVASRERNLMVATILLSLLVVVPVYIMTFMIAWKYRASNKKATYTPDWDHHLGAEVAWWGIPTAIILVLSVMTWNSAHTLDPYRQLATKGVAPLNIQVIAMDWKWLFIYPEQHIATVNMIEFPVNTPLNFEITSDAPMNSFWIPQLGGQIYAMPGMITQLHLMADQSGKYHGSSANISGAGFAGMDFTAHATSESAYDKWVSSTQTTATPIDAAGYKRLARPSQNNPVNYFTLGDNNLFGETLNKYLMPAGSINSSGNNDSMQMSGMPGSMMQ